MGRILGSRGSSIHARIGRSAPARFAAHEQQGRQGDQVLTNEAGEVTAHLQGMFMRTARLLQAGIKPVYVFDGKPPEMKGGELQKRLQSEMESMMNARAAEAKVKTSRP